jgi:tetratricopeptide (TPR) repeat protein
MAFPVSDCRRELQRVSSRAVLLVAITFCLCGCSFNLGSLSSEEEAPKAVSSTPANSAAPNKNDVEEAQAATKRGKTLARSGKSEAALEEFNNAINLDPYSADARYNRGLLYQGEKQHEQAIEDFTAANGLIPQHAEPLLGRAISYLALDKAREAAADLDEAAQFSPQNAQIWTTRGLAYERLGDKAKAVGSYSRAMALRPKDEAARNGFLRVGGKDGQSYDTF